MIPRTDQIVLRFGFDVAAETIAAESIDDISEASVANAAAIG
jgi:hypothetical protein